MRRERLDALDRFANFPALIGVDHELAGRPNLVPDQAHPTRIVLGCAADLDLEMRPAVGERFATERLDAVVGVAEPADRRRVRGIPGFEQRRLTLGFRARLPVENLESFVGRQRVDDVAEVDAGDDLTRRHVGEQFPERLVRRPRVQVPHRVDDSRQRQVDDALLRSEPSKLRLVRQHPPETGEVRRDLVEPAADDETAERLDGQHADIVAASDGEGEAMTLQPLVGSENHVRRRVVRIRVGRIGPRLGT